MTLFFVLAGVVECLSEMAQSPLLDFSTPLDVPLLDRTIESFYSAQNAEEVRARLGRSRPGSASQDPCSRLARVHRAVRSRFAAWRASGDAARAPRVVSRRVLFEARAQNAGPPGGSHLAASVSELLADAPRCSAWRRRA